MNDQERLINEEKKMKKKRFIDKYNDYWKHTWVTLEGAGCTNPFDRTTVVFVGMLVNLARMLFYIFLIVTAVVWMPIYGLYCWITERR